MRYFTYSIFWATPNEGYQLDAELQNRGYDSANLFGGYDERNLCMTTDDADLEGLEKYEPQEVAPEDALTIVRQRNAGAYLNDDGRIILPSHLDDV